MPTRQSTTQTGIIPTSYPADRTGPLNKNGTWQYKTEKEYLCVRDGEERGFCGARSFRAATIHEGVVARALEQIGVTSDRCELNRQIKADKKLLRELKAQMERLLKAVKNTIPAIAEAMETVRQNMLIIRYQILHTRASKRKISDTLNAVLPDFRKYTEIVKQLRDKTKERRDLLVEKKATPIFI